MLNYQLLYEIGKHLIAETDMHKLLQLAMDKIIESTQAQRGMITVIDADGALLFETARNLDKRDIEKPEFQVSRTLIDSVLRSGEAVVLANALEDSAYAASKSIVELKIPSVVCAPLMIAGEPFRAIYIDNREITPLFTAETGAWLQECADLSAVAVKNDLARRQLVSRQR